MHHLIHVMGATPGRQIVLFDGSGAEFPAVIQQVGRSEVELSVNSRAEINRELPLDVTLGVALPKGERQKWLVEKAVEVGLTRIVPLRTQRGWLSRSGHRWFRFGPRQTGRLPQLRAGTGIVGRLRHVRLRRSGG